jgi:sec-independent protein translocase protein TatA
MNFGVPELLIILFIVLLLFGARKLPELARSLGKAINEFKKGKDEPEQESDDKKRRNEDPPPPKI